LSARGSFFPDKFAVLVKGNLKETEDLPVGIGAVSSKAEAIGAAEAVPAQERVGVPVG
jgi:hypothetical protein